MMQKTKKFVCYVGVALSLLLCGLGLGYSSSFRVEAVEADFEFSAPVQESYSRGCYVEFPQAYYNSGDSKYETECKIVYPDGDFGAYESGKIHLLDLGEYTLEYTAIVEDVTYVDEKKFNVVNDMAGLFSYSENVTAEANAKLPDYFGENDGVSHSAETNEQQNKMFWSSVDTGVKFNVGAQDEVTSIKYNGIIDLAKLGYENAAKNVAYDYDNAPASFVEFVLTPAKGGAFEVEEFEIVLTDVYDETNYLRITLSKYPYSDGVTYVSASPKDMYEGKATVAGGAGWITSNAAIAHASLTGQSGNINASSFSLFYDYSRNRMDMFPCYSAIWPVMHEFANEEEIGYGNAWEGFTTGEVYLTFNVKNVLKSEMSFMVLSIGGQTYEKDYTQINGVDLYVFNRGFNSTYDYVICGKDRYFDVFDAVASVPNYGNVNVNLRVFYGENKIKTIPVRNGRFAVEEAGLYTLEYSVETPFGKNKKEFYVTAKSAVDKKDALRYEISDEIPTQGVGGTHVFIQNGWLRGGLGETSVTYEVFLNGNAVAIDYSSIAPSFELREVGDYVIQFTAKDSLGNTLVKEHTVTCVADGAPQIVLPVLPMQYLKGHFYKIYEPIVRFVTEGDSSYTVKTLINGTEFLQAEYAPSQDFTLQYVVSYGNAQTVSSETVSCKVVEELQNTEYVSSYFYASSQDMTKEVTQKGMLFGVSDASLQDGGADFEMLNSIADRIINLTFSSVEGYEEYRGVEFTLTDVRNPNEVVTLSYEKEGNYTIFKINGNKENNVSGSLGAYLAKKLGFEYNADTYTVFDQDGKVLSTIRQYENGTSFKGFTSGSVYLSFRLLGVSGESKILIDRIASQAYTTSVKSDSAGPNVILLGEMPIYTYFQKGETVVCPAAIAYDSFNGVKSLKLVIKAPDGTQIYNGDISKPYSFVVEQYGIYNVQYEAVDNSVKNVKSTKKMFVTSIAENAPVISIEQPNQVARVGEEYTLATANVSSEVSTTLTVYIVAENQRRYAVNGQTYTFTEKGRYSVVYYAVDKYGKFSSASYEVEVI